MAKFLLTVATCLITASALAQAPREEGSGDNEGGRPRMRRGQDGEQPGQPGGEERGGRGRGRGPEGGPDGGRGGPGGFRRPNPMFEAIDINGDGEINAAELKKAIVALKKLDVDGDNVITLAEVTPQGGPGGFFSGDPAQMIDQMFKDNDKDGDGFISKEEMPERGARMLESADKDGDGKVSKEEATTAMEDMRNRFRGGGPGGPNGGGPGGGRMGDSASVMTQLDKNGDGKISAQEAGQMGRMMQGGDTNSDGQIDKAELEAIMQRMSQQRGGGQGGYGRGRGGDDAGGQGQGGASGGRQRGTRPEAEK